MSGGMRSPYQASVVARGRRHGKLDLRLRSSAWQISTRQLLSIAETRDQFYALSPTDGRLIEGKPCIY